MGQARLDNWSQYKNSFRDKQFFFSWLPEAEYWDTTAERLVIFTLLFLKIFSIRFSKITLKALSKHTD